uniref:Uncharacterized protein n=1 Tax=viral metagenome TaxID=1070528 RepID=A0A6M3JZN9_9ZZZZ
MALHGKSVARTPEDLERIRQMNARQQQNFGTIGPTNQSQSGDIQRANPVVNDWLSQNYGSPLGTNQKTQDYRNWMGGWQQQGDQWKNPYGKFADFKGGDTLASTKVGDTLAGQVRTGTDGPPPINVGTPPIAPLQQNQQTTPPPANTGLGQSANGVSYVGSFTGAGGKKTFMDANGVFYAQDTNMPIGQIDKATGLVFDMTGTKPLGYMRNGIMYDMKGTPQNFDQGGQFDLKSLMSGAAGTGGDTLGQGGGVDSGSLIPPGATPGAGGDTMNYSDYWKAMSNVLANPLIQAQMKNIGMMSSPEYMANIARPQMNMLMQDLGARNLAAPGSYGQTRSEELMGNLWADNLNQQTTNLANLTNQTIPQMFAYWKPEDAGLDLLKSVYLL